MILYCSPKESSTCWSGTEFILDQWTIRVVWLFSLTPTISLCIMVENNVSHNTKRTQVTWDLPELLLNTTEDWSIDSLSLLSQVTTISQEMPPQHNNYGAFTFFCLVSCKAVRLIQKGNGHITSFAFLYNFCLMHL